MLEYVAIALMIVLATLVALIAIGMGNLFGPRKKSAVKSMPYESGMPPIGEGTRRMPIRFYLIAVLFILFDIEVIFSCRGQSCSVNWAGLASSKCSSLL